MLRNNQYHTRVKELLNDINGDIISEEGKISILNQLNTYSFFHENIVNFGYWQYTPYWPLLKLHKWAIQNLATLVYTTLLNPSNRLVECVVSKQPRFEQEFNIYLNTAISDFKQELHNTESVEDVNQILASVENFKSSFEILELREFINQYLSSYSSFIGRMNYLLANVSNIDSLACLIAPSVERNEGEIHDLLSKPVRSDRNNEQGKLRTLIHDLNILKQNGHDELSQDHNGDIILTHRGHFSKISSVLNTVREIHNTTNLRGIRIYTSYSLLIDTNVYIPVERYQAVGHSPNIIIISPKIVITNGTKTIDLSCHSNVDYPDNNSKAPDRHEGDSGANGTDGKPGLPGYDGGNLLMVYTHITGKVEFLAKGGQGGPGQGRLALRIVS